MTRSDLLRSGPRLLSSAGLLDARADLSDEEINNLSVNLVLRAFHLARFSETRVSRQSLAASGTLQKYRKTVANLTQENRQRNPFEEFERRCRLDLWRSKNTRQRARSALVRHAAEKVVILANLFIQDLLKRIADRKTHSILKRAYQIYFLRPAVAELEPAAMEGLPLRDLQDLGLSVGFLLNHPPHPFGSQNQIQTSGSSPQTRSTKRSALSALNRHQARKQKLDADYDWRSKFWDAAVLRDEYISDHMRACISILMITGCRPSELSERHGVTVKVEDEGTSPALVITIQSSKADHGIGASLLSTIEPGVHNNAQQTAFRGQPYRQMLIRPRTPEALWLARYCRRQQRSASLSAMNSGVQLTIASQEQSKSGVWLHPAERDRRVSVKLGKLIGRLGKIAFPRLATLTPYVFRHAVTSDLKSDGDFSAEQIACALGHRSTRTGSIYGSASSMGKRPGIRAGQVVSAFAPEPIRSRQTATPRLRSGPAGCTDGCCWPSRMG